MRAAYRPDAGPCGATAKCSVMAPRKAFKYPSTCGISINTRQPTERERWIDLRPGAENPQTPTKPCGVALTSWEEERRHMTSAHPGIWAVIDLLAQVRARRIREDS